MAKPCCLATIFSRDSLCLSAVSLYYRGNDMHDILDFSCCPLSRVLHVTLASWQRFGFEFHLRSSPSAYSGFVKISRPAEYLTACYTVLKRPNKVETTVHGCNLAFSLDSIVSLPREAFYVVSALHHCLLVFLFLADQIFYRSYVDRQHFRLRSFASLCLQLEVSDNDRFKAGVNVKAVLTLLDTAFFTC